MFVKFTTQERISAVVTECVDFARWRSSVAVLVFVVVAGCQSSRIAVHKDRAQSEQLSSRTTPALPRQSEADGGRLADTSIEDHAGAGSASDEIIEVAYSGESLTPSELEPTPAIAGWTLQNFESLALANNPAIQQAAASAHKAMGYREQVGLKPNPVIGYNGTQLGDRSTDQHVAFVEQDFVTADKLCKNRMVLEREVQSQLWEVQTQRQRVLTDIRRSFYRTLAAQRRLELANEFLAVAEKGVQTAQARLNAQEGSRTDLLQSEIQLKQVQVQKSQAEAGLRAAWKQLVTLAGVPEETPKPLVGSLPSDVEQHDWQLVSSAIIASSPEMHSARSRLARAQANMDRQEAQATPNLSLMVAAGRDNGTGSGLINTQIGLPLPIHNANEGNISAAHSEFCRASQDVRRTELAIESRLAQARNDYESAAAAVDQYKNEILPRAIETLRLVEEAYTAGEFDFLQVLVARRTYFDSNLAYLTAQSELAQAASLIDGLVLTGGLEPTRDTEFDSALRDQALSGQ